MYKKIIKSAIIPLKSSKIPEIIIIELKFDEQEKKNKEWYWIYQVLNPQYFHATFMFVLFQTSASFTFSPLISMFSAIKNSFWLNNSIIYQTPSKSFFLSAIPFKNKKHLQCNQLQFSFFPWQILHFYTFFSLFQICHIFTCYIMPFCFLLQICHILLLWILNLNFSYTSTDKVRFFVLLWQIC